MHGSRSRQTPSEMTIKRAQNGGFLVTHRFDNSQSGPSYQPPAEYVFKTHGEMAGHVKTHFGGAPPETPTQHRAPTVAEGKQAARTRGAGVD